MRAVAVLIVTALLLAGCGAGKSGSAHVSTHSLCVVSSLPLSGGHAALGRALQSGIQRGFGAGTRIGDGYTVRLCHSRDDTPADGRSAARVIAANTLFAVSRPDTVAYIGEVDQAGAAVSAGLLSQQGIPLLSLSTAPGISGLDYGAYMLGTSHTQQAAARALLHAPYRCRPKPARGHRKTACLVVSTPLCTAIGPTLHTIPRVCAAPGPNLARYREPAVAYGEAAAKLLIRAMQAVVSNGSDPAERDAIGHQLLTLGPTQTPLGSVHFTRSGALTGMGYSMYHVARNGALSYDRPLRLR